MHVPIAQQHRREKEMNEQSSESEAVELLANDKCD